MKKNLSNTIKVTLAGLDFAGKTTILTAFDEKFDFKSSIESLKPTVKVDYKNTDFLGTNVVFWDMGGQKKYRDFYKTHKDMYLADVDLLLYIIDIQDKDRYNASLDYLDAIIEYFIEQNMNIPFIISFHKFDPELRNKQKLIEAQEKLQQQISEKYPNFQILYQTTSVYDILSIIQLISYGLSVFDEKFFELSELLEYYTLDEFQSSSLILFDENGIIISEYYGRKIRPEVYTELVESIKEHMFLLKRMKSEDLDADYNFFNMENHMLSYLHRIDINGNIFYISILLEEQYQDNLIEIFPVFLDELKSILNELL